MTADTSMHIIGHIAELRKRLLYSVYAVLITSTIALFFSKDIFLILQIPMLKALPETGHFIATTPFESYKTYFKIALLVGLLSSTPFIFYQFWRFVTPALHPKEKTHLLPFAFISGLLFTGGALFGYFVVFPTGFYYVNAILDNTSIQLLPRMSDYLNVASTLLLAFGVCFELPLFIYLLGKLGIVKYQQLRKARRIIIVGLFVLAAVLTPGPDVLSQCLLALPMWFLYEMGSLSVYFMQKKKAKEEPID